MVQLRLYTNFREVIRRLSYEEKGQLFDAMLAYAEDKTLLPLEGKADVIWDFVQQMLNAQWESYEDKCANISKAREQNPKNNKELISDNSELKSGEDNLSLSNFEVQDQVQIKEQIKDKDKITKDKIRRKRDYDQRHVTNDDFRDLFLDLNEQEQKYIEEGTI